MAREFATSFYSSVVWQACRAAYLEHVGGLCEDCLARGIYTPAEIVHHITPLTPENIKDAHVALGFDNLRALCRECHARAHGAKQKRFTLDELGRVSPREQSPLSLIHI